MIREYYSRQKISCMHSFHTLFIHLRPSESSALEYAFLFYFFYFFLFPVQNSQAIYDIFQTRIPSPPPQKTQPIFKSYLFQCISYSWINLIKPKYWFQSEYLIRRVDCRSTLSQSLIGAC